MKINLKRNLSGLLTLFMLAAVMLGGCTTTPDEGGGTNDGTGTTTTAGGAESTQPVYTTGPENEYTGERTGLSVVDFSKPPVELTIFTQTGNYSGNLNGWSSEILLDKFNVKIIIVNDKPGTFATRLAGKDLGDIIIFGGSGKDYTDAIKADLLFDWEEDDVLADFAPFINANMKPALEKNREISGGTVYGFGHDVAKSSKDHDAHIYYPYLRWDLYEKLGKPQIKTLEDFIPVLQQMQELEPTSEVGTKTYGVSSFKDWDGDMVMMVKATAALYGWEELGVGVYHVTDQIFQGCLEEDGMYLRCLKFYNKLNQLGLFDPDSMTQTFNDVTTKYKNGVSFFNIFTFVAETFNTEENLKEGRALQCIPADDQKNVATGLNVYGKDRIWAIGSKSNYPELCMEIINWLATPEGVMTYNYGPQGVTWDYNEKGDAYLTEVGLLTRKNKKTMINFNGKEQSYKDGEFQHNNPTWSRDTVNPDSASGETYNWEFWESTIDLREVFPIEASWREWAGNVKTGDEMLRNQGKEAITIGTPYEFAAPDVDVDVLWTKVTTCIKDESWSAIYAKDDAEFEKIVERMITNAKAYGYDECVEWTQSEADRRAATENAVKAALQ
ncbi:MAG: hypothetical protein FWF82_04640 [Oscillospiraceae bacterium]|nr:hypothetical protein [Oscillospiraceae bacterium]